MHVFEKQRVALRYWLLGAGHDRAYRALHYAATFHTGLRKDKQTPEFAHQVWIASHLRTLPVPAAEMDVLIASALLHDTPEDADVGFPEINRLFGPEVSETVRLLTKMHRGVRIPDEHYYQALSESARAMTIKGVDRLHNITSMVGVFTQAKQVAYMEEVDRLILPALHRARQAAPEWEPALQNISVNLKDRLALIRAIHEAEGQAA
jgi:(p)ppGpp synthase/HD superfamily hydrolase